MSRLWSKPLELLGRLGLRIPVGRHPTLSVGDPQAPDAEGTQRWRGFLRSDRLFDVWGPHPDAPWVPFHCVPLFAALDTLPQDRIGPTPPRGAGPPIPDPGLPLPDPAGPAPAPPRELPPHASPGAPRPAWLTGESWTILDLPGPLAVEAAVWLIRAAGCQPVCTFDNWPHPRGLLRPERTLAELLRWAGTVSDHRGEMERTAPPLWICDAERLGGQAGKPGEFDNRYYLDDSILPGAELLRRNAVRRVVYVAFGDAELPTLDVESYFAELLGAGLEVVWVDIRDPELQTRPFSNPRARPPLKRTGFHASSAGGFGTEVPQPSSGGGG